jgi:hypothetical protein
MVKSKKGTYVRTEEEVIEAIKASNGLISRAAEMLGYASSSSLHARIHGNKLLQDMVSDAHEELKDRAEEELHKKIKAGNLRAITYFLDRQAKDRGYGSDKSVSVNVTNTSVKIDLSRLSMDELKQLEALVVKTEVIDAEYSEQDSVGD